MNRVSAVSVCDMIFSVIDNCLGLTALSKFNLLTLDSVQHEAMRVFL